MNKRIQYTLLFTIIGCFAISNTFILVQEQLESSKIFIGFLINLSFIFFHLFVIFYIGKILQKKKPGTESIAKRFMLGVLVGVPYLFFTMVLHDVAIYHFIDKTISVNLVRGMGYFLQAIAMTVALLAFSEAFYYIEEFTKSERKNQELQKLNIQAQFDSIKQQVSPHFLFNSLNSLSSLISIDSQKAEKFVIELSQVYRYLLQSNKEELVPLDVEFKFVNSYVHLLKTRLESGLVYTIDIPTSYYTEYKIPPLTLQILIENAVKHNEASYEKPLFIDIYTEDTKFLVVQNNIQERLQPVQSEKIGLANIITKFKILGFPDLIIRNTGSKFIVKIPLI